MAGNRRPSFNVSGKQHQQGAVAVVVAITLTGMMAMMGMAMDTGNILAERDKLQNMANAAALSAAKSYFFPNGSYNEPKTNAWATIEDMGATTETLDISITPTNGDSTDLSGRIIANVSKTVSPLMLGMVGIGETTITATATAGPVPEPAYSVAPIMACTGSLDDPKPADTSDPDIYHFLESFLNDTTLDNVIGFRMFIDTTGFDDQILNKKLLYEVTSIMLASGDNVLMYEDTPTRVVDEYGLDPLILRPGSMLNTRLGIEAKTISDKTLFDNDVFNADINSSFANENGEVCRGNCNSKNAFTQKFRQIANKDGRITYFREFKSLFYDSIFGLFISWTKNGKTITASDYPYLYADYQNDLNNKTIECSSSTCKANRRILKVPVAPSCAVNDLKQKEFACFFLLEPARVFIDNALDDEDKLPEGEEDLDSLLTGVDFELRTEFIAQHIPCPTSTKDDKISGAYDIVLYDGGNE
ncbi:pilus assembly protein TadG-related protein [Endozoicomonas sp.]|uniref:pilus assembly protein TadG-related protein n=1 Tax=Endozoicomonas sp. TaxID=1892382 RepID=UPI00383A7DFC